MSNIECLPAIIKSQMPDMVVDKFAGVIIVDNRPYMAVITKDQIMINLPSGYEDMPLKNMTLKELIELLKKMRE